MTTPYVASGPEDLIALAPTVLGFEPEESVLVMTFGRPGRSFHARVDLPQRSKEQKEVAETILRAMKNNHLRRCAVLLYADDREVATAQARVLNRRLIDAGIGVADVILISGTRYFRVLRDDVAGTPFDVSTHRFTARRVLEGVQVHKSRADLAATLRPDAGATGDLEDLAAAVQLRADQLADEDAEGRWLHSVIRTSLPEGSIAESDLARLLAALAVPRLSDIAWAEIDRPTADAHVALWRSVVRRAPEGYVATPACLLAFAAWLSGDGALAWCAIDRCGPTSLPMARMLSELLESAVPPALWPGLSAEELSALRGPAA